MLQAPKHGEGHVEGVADRALPDLSPRTNFPLEWWFIQGEMRGEETGKISFMASIFRQKGKSNGRNGHMFLLSTLTSEGRRHTSTCRVSPDLVANFVDDAREELEAANIERSIVDVFVDEIAKYGPPAPIELEPAPAQIAPTGCSVKWSDFFLEECGGQMEFGFALPEDGRQCRLTAKPQTAWLTEAQHQAGEMYYQSCPRLSLAGTVDGQPVDGRAWVDHQWGDYGWLRLQGQHQHLLGWDWVGINLDNGIDLLVMVRHDMTAQEPVSCFAVVFEPDREPRLVSDIKIAQMRQWTSPDTLATYPVGIRIEIPDIEGRFEFEPDHDGQEIPVFGLMNAVWEGAGRVAGRMAGESVSGTARLELHGYAYTHDFRSYQQRWIDRIDQRLADFLPKVLTESDLERYVGRARWAYDAEAQAEMLSTPVWDLLSRGGKHWRPIFGLLLLDALGAEVEPYETMVSVISELVHNGAVMIDDIEDASLMRRGAESIHLRYGIQTTINAGNTLYFLPLLAIADVERLSAEQRSAIYEVIVRLFVKAHFGQAQDLYWSKLPRRGKQFWNGIHLAQQVLQTHNFKTAAAVRAMSEVACIIAGVSPETKSRCMRLAESWGVAFQIMDDIRNFTAAKGLGKVFAEDLKEGKVSYVICRAIELLEGAKRDRLIEIVDSPPLRESSDGQQEGIDLIRASGAFEVCQREAHELVEGDWEAFTDVVPFCRSRLMLRLLMIYLLALPAPT